MRLSEEIAGVSRISENPKLAWWRYIPWVLVACFLLGLVWLRFGAETSDFGFRNVLSYMLLFAAWIFGNLAMMLTAARRTWLTALLLPVALVSVFLVFFRLERVDSEIIPKFVWRWAEPAPLPEANGSIDAEAEVFFAARSTDFPMFLGPTANSTLPPLELEKNWTEHPPKIVWKQPIGQGWSGFAVQGNAAYTMEQREQEEWVSCYDANSGKLIWHYAIPGLHFNPMGGTGPRATPTIYEGRIYAQSAVSQLVCLDMRSGERVWSADLMKLANSNQKEFEADVAWGRSASPLIADGKVIVPLGGSVNSKKQSLIAFDAKSGQELWRAGSSQISYSTPVIAKLQGQGQILYISEDKLESHSIADGADLWSVEWLSHSSNDASVSQPIVIDDARILLSRGYGGGAQMFKISNGAAWKPESLWKAEGVLRTKFTSCVINDGHAFGLSDGILECVDLSNGKRAWKKGRYRHGQVLLVGDTMVVTAENGAVVLVAADSKEFRELASFQVIGDVTWNTAALSGNRLLMRNSNEAACVLLPLKSNAATSQEPAGE